MNKRRSHPKITSEFPPELVEAINKLIVNGQTYQQITDFVLDKGYQISSGSVKRYGKDFLSRLERLKVVREQAKAIIEDNPDRPATEMGEAANQLATQLIMERLMELDLTDLQEAKVTELLKALALLERSAVSREKLKYEFNHGVEAAFAKLKEALRKELVSNPELLEQIFILADRVKEQTAI